jgi:hypothetical protein
MTYFDADASYALEQTDGNLHPISRKIHAAPAQRQSTRQPQSLGAKTASSAGSCAYDLFVSYDVPFGDGTFTGTARDAFGVRVDTARFTIHDSSGDNDEDDDNNAPFSARGGDDPDVADDDNDSRDNGDDNENENDD